MTTFAVKRVNRLEGNQLVRQSWVSGQSTSKYYCFVHKSISPVDIIYFEKYDFFI